VALADFTFQLDGGIVLNEEGATFTDIDKVSGLDSAPYRETIRDHEGADGGFIDAEFEKGRDIILDGTVYGDVETIEAYLDDIKANFAPVVTPVQFVFKAPGVDERLLFVKSRGVHYDWETARRIGCTPIQFKMFAEDPRIYSSTLSSVLISYGGDAGFGFGFPLGFNIDFGGGATPGGATVSNDGNRPTPAEFLITGPIENPVISNTTSGHTMGFTIALAAGETLTINTRDRTVYLNGNNNRRNTLTTVDWFDLEPGDNFIGFGGLSGTGSTMVVSFRSAWR
jgi:tail protein